MGDSRIQRFTQNVLNDLSRWDERRTLLARGLDALALDLIALQEVTSPLGTSEHDFGLQFEMLERWADERAATTGPSIRR